MNCLSIQNILPSFFLEDLDFETQQLVERHLAHCADCKMQLANIQALDSSLLHVVKRQMDRLVLPSTAWAKIQTRLETQGQKPASLNFGRIALIATVILLISLVLVPPVYARLGEMVGRWLRIQVPSSGTIVTIDNFQAFTPFVPSTLPEGFDLTTTGIHSGLDSDELLLTYARGKDIFLLVQKKPAGPVNLLQGITVDLGNVQGILINPAGEVEERYRAAFTTGMIRLLTWNQDGINLSLYSNMPVEDMQLLARSVHPVQR